MSLGFGLSEIQGAAVALSAVVATVAFLLSLAEKRKAARTNAITAWQRVIVFSIFQKSHLDFLDFADVMTQYRSEAIGYQKYAVNKEEISEQALRAVILELVARRVLDQYGNDVYCLWKKGSAGPGDMPDFIGEMGRMFDGLTSLANDEAKIKKEIYKTIIDNQYTLVFSDLVLRVAESQGIRTDDVKAVLVQLLGKGELVVNENQKVGLPNGRVPTSVLAQQVK